MKLGDQLKIIKPMDICSLLKHKFDAEKMDKFFCVDEKFRFERENLLLDSSNSIFLKFDGIEKGKSYNLLLIFSLCDEQEFGYRLQESISRVAENNVDKIVIWTRDNVNQTIVSVLKQRNTDFLTIEQSILDKLEYISNFYPIGKNYDYAVALNKLCDLMILRLKKLFHLVLSEIAAPSYDHDYGSIKVGTNAIMEFEEKVLNQAIGRLNSEKQGKCKVAVDVGCGTGRHSLDVLKNHFDDVYGFDFSPKMVAEAKNKKRETGADNVVFSVSDMEYEKTAYEGEYHGKTDLVVASFGMGSFVEDTSKMLRRFYEWLSPGGLVFLSFYNKQSVLLKITPSWRDTSLSAHIDVESNTLQVQLNDDTVFQIFCKPYDNNIQSEISKKFEIQSVLSYPTTLALLPNSLLQDPVAEKLFRHVDAQLSKETDHFYGHYVLVVAKKPNVPVVEGYKKIISYIDNLGLPYKVLEHQMVLSVDDVISELSIGDGILVKCVVFSVRGDDLKIVCALPHNERVNKKALSKKLNIAQRKLKFSTENEILAMGFPVGGIPPFGFPDSDNIKYYSHRSLSDVDSGYVYTGVGDNTKTLRMNISDFNKVISDYEDLPVE